MFTHADPDDLQSAGHAAGTQFADLGRAPAANAGKTEPRPMLSKAAFLLAGALVITPAVATLAAPRPDMPPAWSARSVDLASGIIGFRQAGEAVDVRLAPAKDLQRSEVVIRGFDAQGRSAGYVGLRLRHGQTYVSGKLGTDFSQAASLKVTSD
jgi:hypothetical protein